MLTRYLVRATLALATLASAAPALAQKPSAKQAPTDKTTPKAPLAGFDQYIAQAMQDWKVPGLAIAVVKNDSIVLMKGYGTRTMGNAEPVDEHTLFAIGSASKALSLRKN